jgi:hypothetical protein
MRMVTLDGMRAGRLWFRALLSLASVALAGPALAQEQNPLLAQLPENSALDLGKYICPPEADPTACFTNTDYSGMVYDAAGHRMLVFGGGHAATYRDDIDVFDFKTLSWAPHYPTTPCAEMTLENIDVFHGKWISSGHPISRHSYDLLAMAGNPAELWLLSKVQGRGKGCTSLPSTDEGAPYVIAQGTFAAFSFASGTWRFTETPSLTFAVGAETDPVSGRILLVSGGAIASIDPSDGTRTVHVKHAESDLSGGQGVSLVYFPPNDRFYAFVQANHEHGVWEVHFDRDDPAASSVRQLTDVVPPTAPVHDAWDYDSANELIGGGVAGGMFFAFDPVAEVWHQRLMESSDPALDVGGVNGKALAYDPVDNVFIFRTGWSSGVRTWAYRWGGEAPEPLPPADAGAGGDGGAGTGAGGEAGTEASAGAAGTGAGAGASADADEAGGCGCHASARHPGYRAWWIASASLLLVARRVRRRRSAPTHVVTL